MRKILLISVTLIIGVILVITFIYKRGESNSTKISDQGKGVKKMELSGKRILMIVAPENFRDEELLKPKEIFEKEGIEVEVVSKGVKEARGMFGTRILIDKDINEVKIEDCDGIIFVGGTGAAIYFEDQDVFNLARLAFENEKVIGAICIAPSILANAGLLSGKRATAFSSEAENLQSKGAQYTGELVTVEGKIITARGPEAAEEFGKKIVEALR